MTDQAPTAPDAKDEAKKEEAPPAPPKLTPEEEAELRNAAARGSFNREFELQDKRYVIGTASHAADKRWTDDKIAARIAARKRLAAQLKVAEMFVSDADASEASISDSNTAYIASHLRTVNEQAVTYEAAKVEAEGLESVVRGMIIYEIEEMYRYYKALLLKLRQSANVKKS